jgi:hypothetical protein
LGAPEIRAASDATASAKRPDLADQLEGRPYSAADTDSPPAITRRRRRALLAERSLRLGADNFMSMDAALVGDALPACNQLVGRTPNEALINQSGST